MMLTLPLCNVGNVMGTGLISNYFDALMEPDIN